MSGKEKDELRALVREREKLRGEVAEINEDQVKPRNARIRAIDKRMAVVAAEG